MISYKTRVYTDMCINTKINIKKEMVDFDKKLLSQYGCLVALKSWGMDKHKFIYDWKHVCPVTGKVKQRKIYME